MDYNYDKAMIKAYVDKEEEPKRELWYEKIFLQYQKKDRIKWHWSWWAFFGTFLYLLYRKAYLASFVLFLFVLFSEISPIASFLVSIFSGGYAHYYVYKEYLKKKNEIEGKYEDEEKCIKVMKAYNSYNDWLLYLLGLLFVILLGMVGFSFISWSAAS